MLNSNMTWRLSGHISIFRFVCAQVFFSENSETMAVFILEDVLDVQTH